MNFKKRLIAGLCVLSSAAAAPAFAEIGVSIGIGIPLPPPRSEERRVGKECRL